ncbi:hypothetical protein DM01DRAFT_1380945 [Hesseltinella vesiculosa]|uniref:GDP-mannose transporter n=1 Tax=Hesseltinella vesiculosa TaxID=101127 RepID=A0A1X2GT36_9FUNG|nr:hypothetical protein DM01DRAFT_1380945 [Hesseltinella vesiculosa]
MSLHSPDLPLPTTVHAVRRNDNLVHLITNTYVIFAVFATLLSKYISTVSEYKFPYPYTTTLMQVAIGYVLVHLWQSRMRWSEPRRLRRPRSSPWRLVLPVSLMYIVLVVFDPYFTTHVPSTLYIPLKAFSIPVMYTWSQWSRSRGMIDAGNWVSLGCLIQFLGAWLIDPIHSMQWGVLCRGMAYAVFTAAYGSAVQKALLDLHYDMTTFLSRFLRLTCLLLIPVSIFSGELYAVLTSVLFLDEPAFWLHQVIGALLGLTLHILMLLVIKYASAMAFVVAVTAKICLQPLVTAFFFGQPIDFYDLICLVVSLTGAASYFIKKPRSGKPFDSVYSL